MDDFTAHFEIPEQVRFLHSETLLNRPARLKANRSDKSHRRIAQIADIWATAANWCIIPHLRHLNEAQRTVGMAFCSSYTKFDWTSARDRAVLRLVYDTIPNIAARHSGLCLVAGAMPLLHAQPGDSNDQCQKKRDKSASSDSKSAIPSPSRRRPSKPAAAPKRVTKKTQLIKLLSAKTGVGTTAISAKLSWQPHTTRAALSGLRKAGYELAKENAAVGKHIRYRITSMPKDATPAAAGPVADAG